MSGFLDTYGQEEARRERAIRRWAGGILAAVLLALVGYWYFHDYREKRQVAQFLKLVAEKKYEDAYRLWGCDPKRPCRDYNMEKFLEDWGPKSPYGNVARARVRRTRSCEEGIIQILEYAPGDEVYLYVDRKERHISYSPFGYCVDASGRNVNLIDIFFR
ncbi:MAG: hypothetical protein N2036_12205 [Bryobacteraceae bacterium]|nr:hypothetical protein [Bryobacteraceae bacterium]MCX7604830.1 hypothetical protein [Bryobacteraceae bacterium]